MLRCLYQLVPDTLSVVNIHGDTAAHYAAGCGHITCGHINVLRYLHQALPGTLTAINSDGISVIHLAADKGHLDVL